MLEADVASPGLAQRLSEMHDQVKDSELSAGPVTAVQHAALLAQLRTLAAFIESARQEITAVRADDIVGQHVPAATDELDAIVLHTAEATGLILDECETLDECVQDSPLRLSVTGATARIYEACSFQDITGQRVAKVVHTLKAIEARVCDMLRVFGCAPSEAVISFGPVGLLNGPQRNGHAMEQGEVDALLASFD